MASPPAAIHSLIDRLGGAKHFAADSSTLEGGLDVEITLRRAIPVVRKLCPEHEIDALTELTRALPNIGTRRFATTFSGKASRGLGNSIWGALMSEEGRTQATELDGLDLCFGLFIAMLLLVPAEKRKRTVCSGAGAFLRKLADSPELRHVVIDLLGSPKHISRDELASAAAKLNSPSGIRAWRARFNHETSYQFVRGLLNELVSKGAAVRMRQLKPAHRRRLRSRVHPQSVLTPERSARYVPEQITDADVEGAHPEDERATSIEVEQRVAAGIAEGDAENAVYVSHQIRLDGNFVPFSQFHLSEPEARACAMALRVRLKGSQDAAERRACCVLILVGIQGRDVSLIEEQSRSTKLPIGLCPDGKYVVPIPGAEYFWQPDKHGSQIQAASTVLNLAIPSELWSDLQDALVSTDATIGDTFNLAIRSVVRWLRRDIACRFTLDRWRATLPLMAMQRCGDSRKAQLLCGDRLGMSDAPLYYAAFPNEELQSLFANVISSWWGVRPDAKPVTSEVVGSSLGGQPIKAVRSWVEALRLGDVSGRPPWDIPSFLKIVNDLSRWTGWFLCASTGFRNKSIGKITRIDMSTRLRLACLADKIGDPADYSRVVCLGHQATDQTLALIAAYRRLRERLIEVSQLRARDRGIPKLQLRKMIRVLDDAVGGDGALILRYALVDGEHKLLPASSHWMLEPLTQLGIPENAFRHVLASRWIGHGGVAADLFAQLGHSTTLGQPFGRDALRSVLDFRESAEKVVDAVVLEAGWGVVAPFPVTTADRDWSPGSDRICDDFVRSQKELATLEARSRAGEGKVRGGLRSCTQSTVRTFLEEEKQQGKAAVPHVFESDISALIAQIQAVPTCSEATSDIKSEVYKEIRSCVRRGACSSDFFPVRSPIFREASTIFRSSLHSADWALRVQRHVVDLLQHRSKHADPDQIIARIAESEEPSDHARCRLALLSIAFLPVKSEDALLHLLNARVTVRVDQKDGCLLEDERGSSCFLPDPIALAALRAQSFDKEPFRRIDIERLKAWARNALAIIIGSGDVLPSVRQWIDLVRASAAVQHPGFWWHQMICDHETRGLDSDRSTRWAVGGLTPDRSGESPALARQYNCRASAPKFGVRSGNLSARVDALRKVLSKKKAVDRTVDDENVGLGSAKLAATKTADIRRRLKPLLDEMDSSLWTFGMVDAVLVRLLEALCAPDAKVHRKEAYAVSTIGNYFQLVCDYIVPLVETTDCSELEVDEWLDLYVRAMDCVPPGSRSKASTAFRWWHKMLVVHAGIGPIGDGLWPWPHDEEPLDAQSRDIGCIVTTDEHEAVHSILDRWGSQADSGQARRLLTIASHMWVLLFGLGLRGLSEASALRHRDIERVAGGDLVHVRVTQTAGLKTPAARRSLPATELVDSERWHRFREWLQSEKDSAGQFFSRNAPIFPDLHQDDGAQQIVWRLLTTALSAVTRRSDARPYWARHGFATINAAAFAVCNPPSGVANARGMCLSALRVMLGHASTATSVLSYIHLRQYRFSMIGVSHAKNSLVAALAGRTHAAHLNWTRRREIGKDDVAGQLTALIAEHISPQKWRSILDVSTDVPTPSIDENTSIDAVVVGRILHLLWHEVEWKTAVWRSGLTRDEQKKLFRGLTKMMIRLPELALQPGFQRRIRSGLGEKSIQLLGAGIEPSPRRRYLPELPRVCENLDQYLSRLDTPLHEIIRALEFALQAGEYRIVKGALRVPDAEDFRLIHSLLAAATAGTGLDVGVSTFVVDGHTKEVAIATIREALEGIGFGWIQIVPAATSGASSIDDTDFGLTIIRHRSGVSERATVTLAAIVSVTLTVGYLQSASRS